MAKKHRYSNNGVALDTALSVADLRTICAQAAVESTGDLWNGTQRVVEVDSGLAWISYAIQGSVTGWNKFMTFTVALNNHSGRSTLQTEITSYSTSQTTLMYFIPVSPKKMRARHTYLQFTNKVANTVGAADPSARIVLSEGDRMPAAALPVVGSAPEIVAAPTPAPSAVAPPAPPPTATTAVLEFAGSEEVDELTHKARRAPRPAEWTVTPQGMASRPLATSLLIGRRPSSQDGPSITVPRNEDTVSKRHAVLELIDGVAHVTDLESINGTVLVGRRDEFVECPPHTRIPIPPGFSLELGEYSVVVEGSGSRA